MRPLDVETVGGVTGRLAHDYNNLLLAILGFGSLLSERPGDREEAVRCTAEIIDAAQRALELTQRLREVSELTETIPLGCASPSEDLAEAYRQE